MRETMHVYAFLVVYTVLGGLDAASDANVTSVNVTDDASKMGVTEIILNTEDAKGTVSDKIASKDTLSGAANVSDVPIDVRPSDATSSVSNATSSVSNATSGVSDPTSSVSDPTSSVTPEVIETDGVNQTTPTRRAKALDANETTSSTYDTVLSSEPIVEDNAYNGSWSSNDDPPSVILTSCEMTTERRLSVIQSPGFPSPYSNNVECRYAVKRYSLDVCSVTFLFNVFDLEASEACAKDYVDLHGERLCGAKTTGLTRSVPFRSSVDDQVVLRFRSDSFSSGVGFMATVVQQECPPPDCDHQFTGIKFEIRSPGFPGPYENRQLCDYTVVRAGPNICRIRFQIRLFDLEAADHCDADSLEIKGDKLCGNIPAGEIVSVDFREPLLMLRFRSDHTTTRDGFHLLGTQEECSADDVARNVTVTEDSTR